VAILSRGAGAIPDNQLKVAACTRHEGAWPAGVTPKRRKRTTLPDPGSETLAHDKKGCDIGYVPATDSGEGANNVETCTVTALMRSPLSRYQTPAVARTTVGFFGFGSLRGLPRQTDHPAYFGLATYQEANPFSRRRCSP